MEVDDGALLEAYERAVLEDEADKEVEAYLAIRHADDAMVSELRWFELFLQTCLIFYVD